MAQERTRDPWRLLLVEDDRELVELLTGVLRDEGYAVDVATDGQRGLHLGLTRTYDVLVIDRRLPVLVLGDSRDRSPAAEAAWRSPVPQPLIDHLAQRNDTLRPELAALWDRRGRPLTGTWEEVFGDDWEAEEAFMAWGFADYAEALAASGRTAKPLPMYVNAWLGPQPGQHQAGEWPSGGSASRVIDVWKATAPSIDLLAPDVYVDDAKSAFADHTRPDNPLFVPESRFRTGSLFWALGHHHAIGFSVFGIEDGRQDSRLSRAYALLAPMQQVITAAQAEGRIAAVLPEKGQQKTNLHLNGYDIAAQGARELFGRMLLDAGVTALPSAPVPPSETNETSVMSVPADTRPMALLITEHEDQFLLVGQDITVDFSHTEGTVEVDSVEEGRFDDEGTWITERVLNGDERLHVLPTNDLGAVRIRLLRRPAHTHET